MKIEQYEVNVKFSVAADAEDCRFNANTTVLSLNQLFHDALQAWAKGVKHPVMVSPTKTSMEGKE